jgi:hypothetical protein
MQKLIDYKLVKNSSPDTLEADVRQGMSDGWVPSGVIVTHDGELIQAMVKFD